MLIFLLVLSFDVTLGVIFSYYSPNFTFTLDNIIISFYVHSWSLRQPKVLDQLAKQEANHLSQYQTE